MKYIVFCLLLCCSISLFGQQPKQWNSSEIYMALEKLNFLGSVLYVAAHPDDENQRIISHFANERHARTAYLSLTRGDGGQNLIGPEIREELGVIRTQELLAARSIDGGQQFFSRANDFGYSKHPDETFDIWNKEEVLSDVVWTIRKFKPDIIINRFDHRSPGRTHGHHTGSAMLSVEAFDLTNDKNVYPEHLNYVEPHQVSRIFFNTSWWFYGSYENFQKADKSLMMAIDIGTYYPLLGKSNTEIAAEARSMHKCQGFGSSGSRGTQSEYIELIKGSKPNSMEDPFEGINTTWSRVKGGEEIGSQLKSIMELYDFNAPSKSVPALLDLKMKIENLEDKHWKSIKLNEIDEIIRQCMGLFVEIRSENEYASPGYSINTFVEIVNRSEIPAQLTQIQYLPSNKQIEFDTTISNNEKFDYEVNLDISADSEYSSPYWLNEFASLGMYYVSDQTMRGIPENGRPVQAIFNFDIEGKEYSLKSNLVFKRNDPVKGEVYQPFEIIPAYSVDLTEDVYIFPDEQSKTIEVVVKAGIDNAKGDLSLDYPEGWSISPSSHKVEIAQKGAELRYKFELTPPANQDEAEISPVLTDMYGNQYNQSVVSISYDHIPTQTITSISKSKVVKLDIKTIGNKVAYIMGAGDVVPENLKQIGYDVDVLQLTEINQEKLRNYDAVITGIRAYNTLDRLVFYQDELLKYVENGGTMIVQYNTTRRLKVDNVGPYPLKLSRVRVTDEKSPVKIIAPDHSVVNFPNKISMKDFDGWVQERGLYFPDEWDSAYEPILEMNDPGEESTKGSLLVAKYGSGYYIYSGISWFRELPAGVAGAYRLFANLISLGKNEQP